MADLTLGATSLALAALLPAPHFRGSKPLAVDGPANAVPVDDGESLPSPKAINVRKRLGVPIWCSEGEAPLRISLLLSLMLLSLGVLEAAPSSWLIILDNRPFESAEAGRIHLASAYRFVLWADCILIAVVVPALLGIIFVVPRFLRTTEVSGFLRLGGTSEGTVMRTRDRSLPGRVFHVVVSTLRFVISLVVILGQALVVRLFNIGRRPNAVILRSQSSGQLEVGLNNFRADSTTYTKRTLFVGSLLGLACSFASLRTLGAIVTDVEEQIEHRVALKVVVSQICALGVLISSLLSGFGSVSMPHSCLAGLYLSPVSSHNIASAQEDYQLVLKTIEDKRLVLADMRTHRKHNLPPIPSPQTSSFRRRCLSRTTSTSKDDIALSSLVDEISFLETLSEDLRDEIEEMKFVRTAAKMARTPIGRIRGWVGVIFSVVLLIRVALAFVTVVWSGGRKSSNARTDPITAGLSWMIGHHLVDEDRYNSLSQLSSLILTGFLSVTQVRTFLRTCSALNRRLGCLWKSRGDGAEMRIFQSSPGMCLTASIMGSYFLCCLVLMKMNLPLEYRSAFSSALRGFDFSFDSSVTNTVFVSSALVSAVVLGMLFGIQRQNSALHNTVINMDTSASASGKIDV